MNKLRGNHRDTLVLGEHYLANLLPDGDDKYTNNVNKEKTINIF